MRAPILPAKVLPALALLVVTMAAGAARADDPFVRQPTYEERRMIALVLKAEGFAPCTNVSLVSGRWSCRARNAAGQNFQLSLSNLDFALIGRQRVE
jgi:hypothetical protein